MPKGRCPKQILVSILVLVLHLALSGTARGQQPETPQPEDELLHLEAALEQLADGNTRKARRILAMMEPGGAGSLREILICLIDGYTEFERHLPNQIRATSRAHRFLDQALWHTKKEQVAETQYQQALALIRELLDSQGANRATRMARSLICHLRMLSGSEPTENEPITPWSGEVHAPERIFFPVGAFTDAARRAKLNGIMISQVLVDSEGCVVDVRILKGLPYGLNESMIDAFKWWSFEPATVDDQPIGTYYDITTRYAID